MNPPSALIPALPNLRLGIVPRVAQLLRVTLLTLPLVYVNNPVFRLAGVPDDSSLSYVPTALIVAGAALVALLGVATRRLTRPCTEVDGPLMALGAAALLGAGYGLAVGNPRYWVVGDLFQICEFIVFFFSI